MLEILRTIWVESIDIKKEQQRVRDAFQVMLQLHSSGIMTKEELIGFLPAHISYEDVLRHMGGEQELFKQQYEVTTPNEPIENRFEILDL